MARAVLTLATLAALAGLLGPDCVNAVRESVADGLSEEVRRLKAGRQLARAHSVTEPPSEDEDEDEDEDDAGEDGPKDNALLHPGKKHGEAKYIYKPATDGFRELDKVVESIDAAADDASSKAKTVDTDYAVYRGRMHDTGEMLDRLSLSGEQFKKEVVDYFANAETDRFSPLAVRVPYRDFIPDLESVEKLRVAEVKAVGCQEPVSFCCSKGMVWSDLRKRTAGGCQRKEGECPENRLEHAAVSRKSDTKDQSDDSAKGECVPKDAARYFRKSSDWEDENKLENSNLLGDLALLPEAENLLAEKLSAANTPKHALVQSVCQRKEWVEILDELGAKLCAALNKDVAGHGTTEAPEAESDADGGEDEDEETEKEK